MDMAYLLPNCLILHIPKTGSDWVRKACQAAVRGRIREIGEWHCDLATAKRIFEDMGKPMPLVGTFVRHPLAWYRSAWCYWKETGRFPREDGTVKVECDDFEQFVENCMACEPRGYVSTMYERFTGPVDGEADIVGRQESLVVDLIRFLELAEEEFDEPRIRGTPRQNVRGSRTESVFPGWPAGLAARVFQHERTAIQRFGYNAIE